MTQSIKSKLYSNINKVVNLILTLLFVILYNFSFSQCKSDLENENLKGKVKIIQEKSISVRDSAYNIMGVFISIYDDKGKTLSYIFPNLRNESLENKTIFEFNKKGYKVRENRFNIDGKLDKYLTFKNDSRGNVIKESYFNLDGSLINYRLFKYNSTCDNIEFKTFLSDGRLTDWYKYIFKDGLVVESVNKMDSTSSKLTYDNHNNNIKLIGYDKLGIEKNVIIFKFEYDDKFNWTKQTHFENGKMIFIDERQYEYYD
jgi:hypothetical protein